MHTICTSWSEFGVDLPIPWSIPTNSAGRFMSEFQSLHESRQHSKGAKVCALFFPAAFGQPKFLSRILLAAWPRQWTVVILLHKVLIASERPRELVWLLRASAQSLVFLGPSISLSIFAGTRRTCFRKTSFGGAAPCILSHGSAIESVSNTALTLVPLATITPGSTEVSFFGHGGSASL